MDRQTDRQIYVFCIVYAGSFTGHGQKDFFSHERAKGHKKIDFDASSRVIY